MMMSLCFTDVLSATSEELRGPDVMISLCFTDVLGATSELTGPDVMMSLCFTDVLSATSEKLRGPDVMMSLCVLQISSVPPVRSSSSSQWSTALTDWDSF